MKNIFLAALIAISATALAQTTPPPVSPVSAPPPPQDPPRKERLESMRIAFLTQKLDLTPEEAQKFWPVYNEFHKKQEDLQKKRRDELKEAKGNIDSLSNKQVEALVDEEMAFRQKNLDLEKEYHAKFKSALPIKKVAKLYRAQDMFAHHLLQQMSDRGKDRDRMLRKKGMNPPPPGPGEEH